MAGRLLSRLGVDEGLVARLAAHGITTAGELLVEEALDLGELADMSPADARALLAHVAAAVVPASATLMDVHAARAGRSTHLPTLLPELDAALLGGVPCGAVTELVGPAGVGKTQVCFMLTLSALLADGGGTVLYIDTERKFSAKRLLEIAAARAPSAVAGAARDALLERVLRLVPGSTRELLARLQELEPGAIERRLRLVLVDSVAALVRAEYGPGQTAERQALLNAQAALLKRYAEAFALPVVVVNQVTTVFGAQAGQAPGAGDVGGAGLTAALGTVWAHAVNVRLVLDRGTEARWIKIAKSPSSPNLAFAYHITAAGLELLPGGGEGDGAYGVALAGDAAGAPIQNAVQYQPG